MADFNNAIALVLQHEKGYSNHPDDAGGPTNWGITLATYSAFLKRTATLPEMIGMPVEAARQIYRTSYWGVIGGDAIRSDAVAANFMDMAVLRGVVAAIKTMQACLKLTADGLMGPKTLAAINNTDPSSLVITYYLASQAALANLVVMRPTNIVFLNGWLNRVGDMLDPIQVSLRQAATAAAKATK